MKIKSSSRRAVGTLVAMLGLIGGFSLPANAQDQSAPPTDNAAPALPPGVYPSSPLAQVIKLTEAGVSEGVIMAYATNSGSTFNLDPDKIIYLKDIGVPDGLVTAMMQRDQELKAQMAASAYQPPPQPAPATETIITEPAPDEPQVEQPADVTVNYFYDTLAPYGTWVQVDGYGRCWQPMVVVSEPGWQPYCDHGHWVYTDAGWYWMSDYSWGWAPFHYGRWFHHARFGWCWMPDTAWGPSWVTWRYSDDYCGWAPLPPFTAFVSGIGFTYRGAAVSVGFDFGLGADLFTFVPTRNFCDPHPRLYRAQPREVTQIFSRTTIINNFDADRGNRNFINHGIDPGRITAVTRTEIHPVAIREATAPIARGEQLGRDGRTLMVNRQNFTANPRPAGRGALPPATPPSPAMGSSYQQQTPNGNENNNSQPPSRYPPATPEQGQIQPAGRSPLPGNRYAPITPAQPLTPNNNSIDTRRYPSPRMQQVEQQNPRANPGNPAGNMGAPVMSQAPANPPVPPAAPQQPQRSYLPPRNETPPSESRPSYSQPQPAAGNQPAGASAPSSSSAQPQRSGRDRNQNGQ